MNKQIIVKDLGHKDYKETWDYQESLFEEIVELKRKNKAVYQVRMYGVFLFGYLSADELLFGQHRCFLLNTRQCKPQYQTRKRSRIECAYPS